jgi:uncharacterized damage-inducible protein DinB
MTLTHIKTLMLRDLEMVRNETEQYPTDESLWITVPGTMNSGGNLALHLTGNLRHFIGETLGKTGYVRNREAEFQTKDLTKEQIISLIESCIEEVSATLGQLSDHDLEADFPVEIKGVERNSGFVLLHLLTHLNYHLGQINYHRRMVSAL